MLKPIYFSEPFDFLKGNPTHFKQQPAVFETADICRPRLGASHDGLFETQLFRMLRLQELLIS